MLRLTKDAACNANARASILQRGSMPYRRPAATARPMPMLPNMSPRAIRAAGSRVATHALSARIALAPPVR
jgi:hypothetical protein